MLPFLVYHKLSQHATDGLMEHWPGQTQITEKSKEKGKNKIVDSESWKWPHLDYGSIGGVTLVPKGGRLQWSTTVDTSIGRRWLSLGRPVKVFPETCPPRVNIDHHSIHQRVDKGLQYLRAYYPDADFPGGLVGSTLKEEIKEMRALNAFDPLLGNTLEVFPSHLVQDEYTVVFPMGELGRELNISRFSPDGSGNTVFRATGTPSFGFETPILQIASPVWPSQWTSTPSSSLLVRTHTSSSLVRLEHSMVTREFDITRTETGDMPIVDSRILATGPDIVVVNRGGVVYKCNTHRDGKVVRLIGAHEISDYDQFWQLGVTERGDECFLASCKTVKHIDLRAESPTDVFSLDHLSVVVTSIESPVRDYLRRITTTSDIIWLDDRFRRQPLLSFKHYRSFDRTLRVLAASCGNTSVSLLTSRRNGLVTLYDVGRGTDGLLHCNSRPTCLSHAEPMFTAYSGDALVAFPADTKLTFLRLCQRGSVHEQAIRATTQLDEDEQGPIEGARVTHHWNDDVMTLEKQVDGMQTDLGPVGGKHYTKVDFRGAYKKIFAVEDAVEEDTDRNTPTDMLAALPDVWQKIEGTAENMLTTLDVLHCAESGDNYPSRNHFLASGKVNSKQVFNGLMRSHPAVRKIAGLAPWHYTIQDTSIPTLDRVPTTCADLHEYLKELNLVSEDEQTNVSVRRETEAREQLAMDLALSMDVYSRPFAQLRSFAASEGTSDANRPTEMSYSDEPPEVKIGYFRPIRKAGADHYVDKEQDGGRDESISSPLGVRLLLAEWQLGANPDDYTYRDVYGVVDLEAQPIPQYRKLPAAPPTMQKKQPAPQQPPLVVVAAQPPTVERAPVVTGSQTLPGVDAFSQEPMASTQVLPGPFGGRPGVGARKAGKKRIGGF